MPGVYSTARPGVRSQVASRLAGRARRRRHDRFFGRTGVGPGSSIVDLGSGGLGLRLYEPQLEITAVDRVERPYPGPFVVADLTEPLPFADHEFDFAYCNSVVEHLPRSARPLLAAEIRRIARGWLVQTPAKSFPIEPHSLLPLAQWLTPNARRAYWKLGVGEWDGAELLTKAEMESLFGPVSAERFMGLSKSWLSIQPLGQPGLAIKSGEGQA